MSPGRLATLSALVAAMMACSPAWAARTWLSPVRLAPPAATSEGADVGVDAAGNAVAAWVRDGGVQVAERPVGGNWSVPRDFAPPGSDARELRVQVNARGDALVVWSETVAGGAHVARYRSRPAGLGFGATRTLSQGGVSDLDAELNASGAAVVSWLREGAVEAVVRRHAGDQFSLPRPLSTEPSLALASAGIDAAGNATVVWRRYVGDVAHVESSAFVNGAWSGVDTIPGTSGRYPHPEIAVHASGKVAVMVYGLFTDALAESVRVAYRASAGAAWTKASHLAYHQFPMGFQARFEPDGTPLFFMGGGIVANDWQLYGGPPGGIVALHGLVGFSQAPPFGVAVAPSGGSVVYWSADEFKARHRPPGGPFGPIEETGAKAQGESGLALDDEGNGVLVWQERGSGAIWATPLDAAPPRITSVSVPGSAGVNEPVAMRVAATDRTTAVSASWRFSDGRTATGFEIERAFPLPGTYQVQATVRDAVGNEARATRTITVTAPPVVNPPAEPDADGDGFRASLDCNDDDPAIFPGAPERLGNAVDENCDGHADPYPLVAATVQLTSQFQRDRSTKLLALTISDLVAGDVVRVACRGKGCRKGLARTIRVTRDRRRLKVPKVAGARLRPKTVLKVTISHPDRVARVFTFTMRSKPNPAGPLRVRHCQAPGQARTSRC